MDEKNFNEAFHKACDEAEKVIRDGDKLEEILRRAEEKLKQVGGAGEALSYIPLMISMVRASVTGTYDKVPAGSIVAVVGAILYFVAPVDLIPDFIPVVGLLDDAAVAALALKLVMNDLKEYKAWRDGEKAEVQPADAEEKE